MKQQFDLYTAVVLISILLLIITMADILTNRLTTQKMKLRSVIASLLIAGSVTGEWIGVLTNGAPASFIGLHRCAKLVEFCLSPAIGAAIAVAYGVVKKPKIVAAAVTAHAVFECAAVYFNWVFRIDAQNIYHREGMYFVYVTAFIISLIFCLICIIRSGTEYQTGIDCVLVLTILMTVIGIGIQFVNSNIRIDFLCIAIGNMLLYSRHYKMVLQVDAVTSLLNRRCYEANIGNLGPHAAVIFFDINKFKQVNDTYGHSVGDICLRNIAQRISAVYKKHGSCYRIGGDEFCVILNSELDLLETMNRQFLASIEELQKEDTRMPNVALGYAYYNAENSHIQNIIEEADAMMYKNKQDSRTD